MKLYNLSRAKITKGKLNKLLSVWFELNSQINIQPDCEGPTTVPYNLSTAAKASSTTEPNGLMTAVATQNKRNELKPPGIKSNEKEHNRR